MRKFVLLWSVLLLVTSSLFAQDNPVSNGSFETVDGRKPPQDWEYVGGGQVVSPGHTGTNALSFVRTAETQGEIGLNRRWKMHSGEQGAMLSERKGGLEFWYKVPAAESGAHLTVGLIPMTAEPWEGTDTERVCFEVPASCFGDGQWHRGLLKYDYTGRALVKWVHVAVRLGGAAGQLLLDDVRWVPSVGPLPTVQHLTLIETPGQEGRACSVRAQIGNKGDAPTRALQATLALPDYLKTPAAKSQPVPATAPDGVTVLEWPVAGLRDRTDAITVTIKFGDQSVGQRLALASDLQVEQFRADRFLLAPGQSTALKLMLANHGNAAVRGAVARLMASPAVAAAVTEAAPRPVALLAPGGKASVQWSVTLRTPGAARLEAEVVAENQSRRSAAAELVCGAPLPQVPATGMGACARVWNAGALVGNETIRMVLARDPAGALGPGWLQVRKAGAWMTAGALPDLGSVATAAASAGEGLRLLQATAVQASGPGRQASLLLIGCTSDGWPVTWTLTCDAGADTIDYALTLIPAADGNLYGLHGPKLYVGEGGWGGAKTEAVLPGLEWLVDDEVSSSTLDIDASLPQRWRWCPPPHAVTIPALGVYHDGVTVGLLWDPVQKYGLGQTRLRAIFAAPDRFEGRNACLLGVMAPGGDDPEYWVPPRLATEKPWAVKQSEPLTLRASFYARSGTADALAVMDRWFALHGVPQAQRLPHGKDWKDEIGFSAQAYLSSLLDAASGKWFDSLNGPRHLTTLGWQPSFAYDLVYASRLASDPVVRRRCGEKAAEIERASGQRPLAEDLGFEFANPVSGLMAQSDRAAALMRGQGADGSWRFHARIENGRDYGELGPDQAAEVGTCALNAYTLLRYARMTGDSAAAKAGLKALRFMDRFTVPRAAQVWEVPVHTPDVLASADACEAYLEGYALTGDRQHLKRAVFWARTGLPFCYVWDAPHYEMLRYASIPVFGASCYTCNWFGQPVQWIGLRLARAYAKLADCDNSFPWKNVAEGLAVSGMWQQHGKQAGGAPIWPDDKQEWAGLWPDNFNSVDLKRCTWLFAPRQILDLVYRFMGFHPDPETACVSSPQNPTQVARINACASIHNAQWRGDRISAQLRFTPPQTSQIVICNLARPTGVSVNGIALPAVPELASATGPGWDYTAASRLVCLRPPDGPSIRLEVTGAQFEQGRMAPAIVNQVDFRFDADPEDWREAHDLAPGVVRDGALQLSITGPDPCLVRTGLDLAPGSIAGLLVRLAVPPTCQGGLQVFWITEDSPGFDEAKSVQVPLVNDGRYHDYRMILGNNPLWQGKRVTGLRLDPGAGPAGIEVQLDRVRGL